MSAADIAREIVERIASHEPIDVPMDTRELWVALVTPVIEEAQRDHHKNWPDRPSCIKAANDDFAAAEAYSRMEQRAQAAEKEREDWKQAALTNNETIGLLGDQKAVLKAEVERLTTLRYESVCSEGTAIVATCLACGGLFAKLSPMSDVDCPTCKRERLTQRVRELEAGLRTCADKFREYEALHLKKVPDGVCAVPIAEEFPMVCGVCGRSRPMHEMAERMRAKAGVNASMAATCEALLSQPPAPQPSEPPYVSKVKCADPFGCDPAYGCFDGSEPCSKAPSEPAPLHGCEICAGDDACTCPRMPSGRPMRLSDLPSEPAPPATTPEGAEDVELCPSTEAYCETCGDVHEMTNRCGNPLPCPLHPSPEPERCQQLKLDPNAKNNETFLTEDCGNPLPCNLHPQPCDVTDLDGFPCDAKTPCNLHPEGR